MPRTTGKAKNKLSNVVLDEISFVGKGDNPEAHIVLLKNHPCTILSLGKNYKGKDKADVLKKYFEESKNIQKGDGDAELFADIVEERVMRDKVWNLVWTLEDSIQSIMCDETVTDKQAMIQQSVEQFKEAITNITKGKRGNNSMTKEELEKALEAEKAKSADLEKQLDAVKKEKEDLVKAAAKPVAGEVCKSCGQKMPEMKKEEIDKSVLSEEVRKHLEKVEKENADNKAAIEKMKDDSLTKECNEQGKQVAAIGKAEEIGSILKEASKIGKEFAEKIFTVFKTADARIKEGGLFKEIGSGAGEDGLTALDKINAAAEEHRKAHPELSKEQAWDHVYKTNNELRKAYLAEK